MPAVLLLLLVCDDGGSCGVFNNCDLVLLRNNWDAYAANAGVVATRINPDVFISKRWGMATYGTVAVSLSLFQLGLHCCRHVTTFSI